MMEGLNGSNSGPLGLDDFTYNSSAVRQLLFNYLSETDFEGITVCLSCALMNYNTMVVC